MNLFTSLKEVLTEELINQIATQNNEKPEKVQKAADALGVSIVGGLIKRVTTEYGMNLVFKQIQKIEFEPGQISKLLKNQTEFDAIKSTSEKDLNTLLPGIKSSISSMASKYAGTRNSLTSSLCGIMVAIVMSILKAKIDSQRLDAESLAAYLGDQREGLLNVVPEITDKLIESIGIQALLENFTLPKTEQSGSIPANNEGKITSQPFLVNVDTGESGIPFRTYLPWIGISILVIGAVATGIYFWNQSQSNNAASENDPSLTEARTIEEPPKKDSLVKQATTATVDLSSPMAKYLADSSTQKGKA